MKKRRKRQFTLIEMLVTISIILILAGILLPAFNSARAQSQSTKCKSNLKNLATAWANYGGDYLGVFPPRLNWAYTAGNNNGYWYYGNGSLGPSWGETAAKNGTVPGVTTVEWSSPSNRAPVILCPSRDSSFNASVTGPSTIPYGYNKKIGWITTDFTANSSKFYYTKIQFPAKLVVFCDATTAEWDGTAANTTNTAMRHGGARANIAFADGHIKELNDSGKLITDQVDALSP